MFEQSYYLEPDSKSPKAYVLLRRALEDTERVAIVQFALREKTRLGALRIRDDVLMLQSLLWADEVREASFPALDTSIRISAQEREMSAALVDSMASDFEPEQFTDDTRSSCASSSRRSWRRASRWTPRRRSVRAAEARQRRSDRPDGGPEAQPREEARAEGAEHGRSRPEESRASRSGAAEQGHREDPDAETPKSGTARTRSKTAAASKTGTASKTSTACENQHCIEDQRGEDRHCLQTGREVGHRGQVHRRPRPRGKAPERAGASPRGRTVHPPRGS